MRITDINVLETLKCNANMKYYKQNATDIYIPGIIAVVLTTANMAFSSSELSSHLLCAHIWLIAPSSDTTFWDYVMIQSKDHMSPGFSRTFWILNIISFYQIIFSELSKVCTNIITVSKIFQSLHWAVYLVSSQSGLAYWLEMLGVMWFGLDKYRKPEETTARIQWTEFPSAGPAIFSCVLACLYVGCDALSSLSLHTWKFVVNSIQLELKGLKTASLDGWRLHKDQNLKLKYKITNNSFTVSRSHLGRRLSP